MRYFFVFLDKFQLAFVCCKGVNAHHFILSYNFISIILYGWHSDRITNLFHRLCLGNRKSK